MKYRDLTPVGQYIYDKLNNALDDCDNATLLIDMLDDLVEEVQNQEREEAKKQYCSTKETK